MKIRRIVIFVLVITLSLFGVFCCLMGKQKPCEELIETKLKDIRDGIGELSHEHDSTRANDNLIILTEIKQDSKIVIDLMLIDEATNEEIAVGDFLGYIYMYIRNCEKDYFSDDSYEIVVKELLEVKRIFSRIGSSNRKRMNEIYNNMLEEIERSTEKYPYNRILMEYNNRTVPKEYQIK